MRVWRGQEPEPASEAPTPPPGQEPPASTDEWLPRDEPAPFSRAFSDPALTPDPEMVSASSEPEPEPPAPREEPIRSFSDPNLSPDLEGYVDERYEHPLASEASEAEPTFPAPAHTPEPAPAAAEAHASPRVSVREPPPPGEEDEYQWHTGLVRPTGMPDAVEFIDVYKSFGRNARILRGLNMGLPEGKISMILGPSGTGKSVCIKHMVGLLYPDDGDVIVHGESVPAMEDRELFDMRKKFGVLFQDGALFGSMNVWDNVAFPLRQHTEKSEEEVGEIVNSRLQEVGLGTAGTRMPNELSGGMRKRAGFARALVLDPDIVLFDEPDSGLDPVRTALLGELIQEIHEEMMGEAQRRHKPHLPAFTLITHDIMTARRVAEHISVLWKGRIVESGPAEELFNSDNAFVRQFLAGESQGPLGME
ncbi:MAG TPA: ATP-binding cassette domain-containing protein [Solirubrobacteraceae bacterium]|jgi:phospholipid/cholesterol/gamma-HCH transport system ATP-binding protein|nr:ATP-binding cassette domain-containing protein [Solirubrobacteraceae bacterium]